MEVCGFPNEAAIESAPSAPDGSPSAMSCRALLPQLGGFEGFGLREVQTSARDHSILDGEDLKGRHVDFDAALTATRPQASVNEHLLMVEGAELLNVDPEVLPGLDYDRLVPLAKSFRPHVHAIKSRKNGVVLLHLPFGMGELSHGVWIAAVKDFQRPPHQLHVLLRHRLLRKPDRFEGFGSLLEQPKASDLPVFDCEHPRAARAHFDPLAPPKVGGIRDHDFGTRVSEALRRLNLGLLKREEELVPQGLALATIAIDTLQRPSGTRPVNFRVRAKRGQPRRQVAPVPRFDPAPHDLDVLLRHRPGSISFRRMPREAKRAATFTVGLPSVPIRIHPAAGAPPPGAILPSWSGVVEAAYPEPGRGRGAGEVSALAPRPGGFEGLGHRVVLVNPRDSTVPHLVEGRELKLDARAASAPPAHLPTRNENALAGVDVV